MTPPPHDPDTTPLQAALAAIRSGPTGPAVAAVFDLGALVSGFPRRPRLPGRGDDAAILRDSIRDNTTDAEFRHFLHAAHALAGRTETDLSATGAALFRSRLYGHVYPEAWQLVTAHRAAGHTVVLATGLTEFQVAPVAAELGIEHVLCTAMAATDGVLTGYAEGKPLWRTAKLDAVRAFAAAHDIDLTRSHAYSDTDADLPLLGAIGHPVAVNAIRELRDAASTHGWTGLAFRRRHTPGPADYARTLVAFLALLAGAAVGVLGAARTRRRRDMADGLMSRAADATLRALGVRVRLHGAEHARAPRPAVFVFNHQSQFDVVIMPKVLRGGVTAIVKKELVRNPVFGPLMRFVGVTFLDRSDSATARAQLAPVVHTLREGLSIAVAPEGTRSYTPQVGRFKKGAFHIAVQAGVPVIPVVIRNAGEISWRNSMVARRGTVDVAVLAPIDVSGWDPQHMDDEVEQVRQLFVDTLTRWPENTAATL